MNKDTVIIGLGNRYLSDEGVGGRIAQALVDRSLLPDGVEALDLGTGGLSVLHAISGHRKAVLVDCAFMDAAPGEWRCFSRDEVRNRSRLTRYSLHEGDVLQTMDLAERLGELPDQVCFIGIQPACVEPGEDLSPALQHRFEEYIRAVLDALYNRHPTPGTHFHVAH
jgi:hydrogenase maturation protease